MKIAILGDLHFGARNNNPHILESQRQFFEEFFFPTLEKAEINTIIQVGDVFDQRRNLNVNTVMEAKKFFINKLEGKNYYSLVGNHDTYFRNTNKVNSIDLLMKKHVDGGKVAVDSTLEIEIEGTKFVLVPWLTSENSGRILDEMASSGADVCLGHFEINGFDMTPGHPCTHGLNAELFSRFKKVFSGHFHTRSKSNQIEYIGTPYFMDWNDWDTPKGFVIFDTETKEHTYVENPVETFIKFGYDENLDLLDIPNFKNCFVKMVVDEVKSKTHYEKVVSEINRMGPAELQVITTRQDNLIDDTDQDIVDVDTDEAMISILEGIESKVDKEQIKRLVMDIYKEARSRL